MPLIALMIHFVCQLDRATGVSVRVFLDEINIWIKQIVLPNVDGPHLIS